MDALQAERRPSVARLTAALRALLPDTEAQGLVLAISLIFARHMRFDAADATWPDRDRMLVDPGLGSLDAALRELTGAAFEPGSGGAWPVLGLGTGAALAERLLAARFGRSLVDHRCWVLAPEACLPEGAVLEAAQLAGAWRLNRLVGLVSVADKDGAGLAGFGAAGWAVRRVAAADGGEIAAAVSAALRAQRPTLLACVRGEETWEAPDAATLAESRAAWTAAARRASGMRRAWLKRRARHGSRADFEAAVAGRLSQGWHQAFFAPAPAPAQETAATEASVRQAVRRLAAAAPDVALLAPPEPGLRRLVRGLADAASGAAAHGGVCPVLTARLEETPALDAALRSAAGFGQRLVVLVEEGEPGADGAGRRAALRALPGLPVYRPADGTEAMECAELAFRHHGPGVLLLSKAPSEPLAERPSRTRCVKGGYVLIESIGARAATLIASGQEVALAIEVQEALSERELETAVVSLPCWQVFSAQETAWRDRVLGGAPRIGLEAGGGFGWGAYLGADGLFIGWDTLPPAQWSAENRAAAVARIADIAANHIDRLRAIWTGQDASRKRAGNERFGLK